MRPRMRPALVAAVVAILALAIFAVVSPRFRLFVRSLGGATSPAVPLGESRDAEYAAFLEAVRLRTPSNATIALVLPSNSRAYVSEAISRLAPRRVLIGRENEASFVAAYRYQYRDGLKTDVVPVPNGALFRREVTSRE